jgi:hypothetical protein
MTMSWQEDQNMPVSFTLQVSCDSRSLDEAAQILESLKELYPADAIIEEAPGATAAPANARTAADHVSEWMPHLGAGGRKFWKKVAEHARDVSPLFITFEDLSRTSGIPTGSLRSYHRNAYRAIKNDANLDPLPGAWDGQLKCNVYSMREDVRDKILELTRNDPT